MKFQSPLVILNSVPATTIPRYDATISTKMTVTVMYIFIIKFGEIFIA